MARRKSDQGSAGMRILAGTLIDETTEVSVEQLSIFCSVRRERIVALVQEGVLEPVLKRRSRRADDWRFASESLKRAARAIRLQRELEIDISALGLVLDLLEQIEALRSRIGSSAPGR
jgi:chaperone modulatory protein CbpM